SKEFFAQYKEIYDDFVEFITGKRYIKKGSKWVETPTHEAHFQLRNYFNNDEKQARDFFKRMMGRIVFLYFIQKKGWLSVPKTKQWGEGNPDYLFELYKNAKYKDSFYSEYLVPLFFDTLNNVDVQKESNEFRFPYLNGGLFDKTQDFKYDKIALPAEIFEKLFNTFNNYNFTIYEDAPDEHTVAVDPEMLGHIFENLLEDNKDKGAFYTPKDIVHYMCRESLHNYIFTYTGNEENEDFKAKLKLYNDTFDISIFEKDEIKLIDRALEDVKICDPAIGSGAFPMGLLHEIYHLKIPIEDSKGMKAKSPADLKKHIIEESIYGVDIDSGAVDIARLRFWLSLVVDEVAPQPLPNLAFKIVCANTLIPLGKPKSDLSGSLDIAKAIEKLRHDYFDASKEDKKDLERQFKNLQNKLWATAKEWVSKEDGDIYLKISEFNPFEDKSCTWFDAWWMFGVKDGFDIVIGNPPYVFSRGNLSSEDKKLYKNHYSLTQFKINLYILFIEKGTELLKKNGGTLFYITPNNWLTLDTNSDLRQYILSKMGNIKVIQNYANVFESASVDTLIVGFNNHGKKTLEYLEWQNNIPTTRTIKSVEEYLKSSKYLITNTEDNSKSGAFDFLINIKGKELQECCEVKNGVQAYTVGEGSPICTEEMKKDRVYHSKTKIDNTWVQYLEGSDVNRYYLKWGGQFIKYGRNLSRPREARLFEGERILVRQIPSPLPFCINACYTNVNTINDNNSMIIHTLNNDFSIKYILGIINSKLISLWFALYFGKLSRKVFPQFKINELRIFPIADINPEQQAPFIALVDYLLLLHNKETLQILSHTDNTRIASHFEDILNMMVYELYFEEHMKKVGIDVLQFINPKPIDTLKTDKAKAEVIQEFYDWYQKPDNAVRQRMLLVD
ncbi:MAG: Eco57I restriction-modification methylase domain-containing protein, partial [Bacteroidia bacterium]|nr:Eco57I restriction-modification methylase domain-containing protein [Bacteroidia bacterium]